MSGSASNPNETANRKNLPHLKNRIMNSVIKEGEAPFAVFSTTIAIAAILSIMNSPTTLLADSGRVATIREFAIGSAVAGLAFYLLVEISIWAFREDAYANSIRLRAYFRCRRWAYFLFALFYSFIVAAAMLQYVPPAYVTPVGIAEMLVEMLFAGGAIIALVDFAVFGSNILFMSLGPSRKELAYDVSAEVYLTLGDLFDHQWHAGLATGSLLREAYKIILRRLHSALPNLEVGRLQKDFVDFQLCATYGDKTERSSMSTSFQAIAAILRRTTDYRVPAGKSLEIISAFTSLRKAVSKWDVYREENDISGVWGRGLGRSLEAHDKLILIALTIILIIIAFVQLALPLLR